mgnify:CR=1 FL=1
MKVLFVCFANLQRSPTAERLFRSKNIETKSAGIDPLAPVILTQKAIDRADKIFVMEQLQKDFILDNFKVNKEIIVLDIPDIYYRDDPELIKILKEKVSKYLK